MITKNKIYKCEGKTDPKEVPVYLQPPSLFNNDQTVKINSDRRKKIMRECSAYTMLLVLLIFCVYVVTHISVCCNAFGLGKDKFGYYCKLFFHYFGPKFFNTKFVQWQKTFNYMYIIPVCIIGILYFFVAKNEIYSISKLVSGYFIGASSLLILFISLNNVLYYSTYTDLKDHELKDSRMPNNQNNLAYFILSFLLGIVFEIGVWKVPK